MRMCLFKCSNLLNRPWHWTTGQIWDLMSLDAAEETEAVVVVAGVGEEMGDIL